MAEYIFYNVATLLQLLIPGSYFTPLFVPQEIIKTEFFYSSLVFLNVFTTRYFNTFRLSPDMYVFIYISICKCVYNYTKFSDGSFGNLHK